MMEDSGGPGDPQKSKTTTTPEPLTIKTYDRLDTPPYIIIVESTDKNIGSLHPMKVGRILRNSGVEGIDKITRKGRNKIGIEFINHITANNLTRNGVLQEQEWEAYIPITLVSCKGIIRDVDLDADMDNIVKYAKSACKILAARRLNKREHNKTKDTVEYVPDDKVLLTFQGKKIPESIQFDYVESKYTRCRSKIRCPKCTEEHEETECQKQVPKCIYCGLEHTTLDRNCKERERQKKIKEIIAYNNKSYYEACAMVPTLLSKNKVEFTGNVTDFPQLKINQNSTITVEERYAYARQQSPNRPSYSQTLNNKKRKPTTPITPPIHQSEEYRQCLFPPPCRTPVRSVINSPSQQMEIEESQADSIDVVDFLKIIIEKTNLIREIKRQKISKQENTNKQKIYAQ
ncbi:hypothetical protein JTB14_016326 [Gonioctena quinquepunctata]|nr:hypothetical protein JTB14_016326 [Gonioctena quinquepunctata]